MPLRSTDGVSTAVARGVCRRAPPSPGPGFRSARTARACRPASRRTSGRRCASLSAVPVPSASCQNSPGSRPRCEKKTRRRPSGVHTGAKSAAGSNVRRLSVWRARSHTQMSFSWSADRHRHPRPVRRDARVEVGARRRRQRLLAPLPIHPDQRALRRRRGAGSVHVRERSVGGDDEIARASRRRHEPRQHRHRRSRASPTG